MFGIFASSRIGWAAWDSPENGRPTTPMIFLLATSWRARPGATSALPWVSSLLILMQFAPFFLLYCSTASSAPCSMLTPRLADGPVNAPRYASSTPQFLLLALSVPLPLPLLHAAEPA